MKLLIPGLLPASKLSVIVLLGALGHSAHAAKVDLTGSTYTETFDQLGTGLPAGWDVRTGATASALGNIATFTTTPTSGTDSAGRFKNFQAADGGTSDRALGVRQSGSFGDPGAAFNFNFDATGITFAGASTALSLKLQMIAVEPRSTTWTIQFGIGTSPASWTTLGTWSDPATVGSQTFSFTGTQLSALSNAPDAWIRVAALTASTGSGNRDSMGIDDFGLSYTAVPEPHFYGLGLAALLGFAIAARRRQAATAK